MNRGSQIYVAYNAMQDRLVLRLDGGGEHPLRIWLTRRVTRALWHTLLEQLESDQGVQRQADPENRKAMLAFQHEQAVARGNFSSQPAAQMRPKPDAPPPILATEVLVREGPKGGKLLSLVTPRGRSIDLGLNGQFAHSLCKLIADTVAKTDWDLDLKLAEEPVAAPAGRLN